MIISNNNANNPIISVEDLFFDDPGITPKNPWKPLPEHSLEQSPSYPIIGMHHKYKVPFLQVAP